MHNSLSQPKHLESVNHAFTYINTNTGQALKMNANKIQL